MYLNCHKKKKKRQNFTRKFYAKPCEHARAFHVTTATSAFTEYTRNVQCAENRIRTVIRDIMVTEVW